MQQPQPSSLNASSVVATQLCINPLRPSPARRGFLNPRGHAGCHVLAGAGGWRSQLCFPGWMGALRFPRPAEYFAPFALLDQAPMASKTWRALSVVLVTSVLRTSWKSISFVPSVNISNEGSDANRSQEEKTCLQLRQTQSCWVAVGLRKM